MKITIKITEQNLMLACLDPNQLKTQTVANEIQTLDFLQCNFDPRNS